MSKTIRQLAEDLHITKQAIYQRMDAIDGFRDEHTTKLANRIIVDEAGEQLLINFDNFDKYSQQANQYNKDEHKQGDNKSNSTELKLLMHQLDVKDKQLDAKDKQLERLQKSLDQQQQLQLATINENNHLKQQLKQLDQVQTTDNQNDEHEHQQSKKWWQFWN